MAPDLFWQQTPRTFHAIMQGRQQAATDRYDEAVALAWHVEALARSDKKKRLPSLKKLLTRKPLVERAQSPDDMLASFRAHASAGAPMTIRRIA